MLFNSHIFLFVFLPLTWGLYMLAARLRWARVGVPLLTASSLFFYGFWNPPYLVLLLLSILFNFSYSRLVMTRWRQSAFSLPIGIAVNLALLGYFKYTHFFLSNLEALVGMNWNLQMIVLPLGISFFTFQQIAYLVDFHHGRTAEKSFWHYALFVSFFPQLIAGPIVHHRDVMHQFADPDRFRFKMENVNLGLTFFSIGLFKKVVIADSLSPFAGVLFDGFGAPDVASAWAGTLAYTLQIYFDFSGYSDMAIGLGRLFNIELPVNFDSPYRSTSIADFWRRWHMTLSRFLRDYLYIPLGGNRKGTFRRYTNLMITMLLGGLWHGAGWTFVLWGALHGIYLCIDHGFGAIRDRMKLRIPPIFGWLLTFLAVNVAWVFFRSPTIGRAIDILGALVGQTPNTLPQPPLFNFAAADPRWVFGVDERFLFISIAMILVLAIPNSRYWAARVEKSFSPWSAIAISAVFFIALMSMARVSEFLYFQF